MGRGKPELYPGCNVAQCVVFFGGKIVNCKLLNDIVYMYRAVYHGNFSTGLIKFGRKQCLLFAIALRRHIRNFALNNYKYGSSCKIFYAP